MLCRKYKPFRNTSNFTNKDGTTRWQVVDSLVFHFLRFRNTDPASVTEAEAMNMGERAATQAKLPVIWHQTCTFSYRLDMRA